MHHIYGKCLFILLSCVTLCTSLQILEPFEYYVNTPSSHTTGPFYFNITGELVVTDPINSCIPLKNAEQVRGRIALIWNDNCSLETQARNAQAAGAIGIVQHQWATTQAGRDYFVYTDADRADIILPIVFINGPEGNLLRNLTENTTSVVVLLVSGEFNVWNQLSTAPAGIFLTVLHNAIDLSLMIYALIKLVRYSMKKRTIISVAQVSLTLIIFAMALAVILRLFLLLGGFNVLGIPIALVLGSIFLPDTLLLLSSLVVSFYWFELTSRVSSISRAWSKKLWRPFIAGGVILSVMLILVILWTQYIRIVAVFIAIFVVYALITLAVAIIWIVFGAKLRYTLLHQASTKMQSNSRMWRTLIILIILSACSLITTRIAASLVNAATGNVIAFRTIFEVGHFSFEVTALTQVLLFSTKKKKKSSGGSNSLPRSTEMGTSMQGSVHQNSN